MLIERSSGVPYYLQAVDYIIKQIENGEYRIGDKLPSEKELTQKFGITRLTVRQALAKLVALGWVETRKGSGSFVKHRTPSIPVSLSEHIYRFTDTAAGTADHYRVQLLDWKKELPTTTERETLQMNEGEEVYRLEVLRYIGEEFFSITTNILVARHVPDLEQYFGNYHSLTDILREHYGIRPYRRKVAVRTLFPAGNDVSYFPENQPVLCTKSLLFHPLGSPLEIAIVRMRGDRGELSIEFPEKS